MSQPYWLHLVIDQWDDSLIHSGFMGAPHCIPACRISEDRVRCSAWQVGGGSYPAHLHERDVLADSRHAELPTERQARHKVPLLEVEAARTGLRDPPAQCHAFLGQHARQTPCVCRRLHRTQPNAIAPLHLDPGKSECNGFPCMLLDRPPDFVWANSSCTNCVFLRSECIENN